MHGGLVGLFTCHCLALLGLASLQPSLAYPAYFLVSLRQLSLDSFTTKRRQTGGLIYALFLNRKWFHSILTRFKNALDMLAKTIDIPDLQQHVVTEQCSI
jgi:hypothetical protein